MARYAILAGCAKGGFVQSKIKQMHDFLTTEEGGAWKEKEIMIFPNGVSAQMLIFAMKCLKEEFKTAETDYFLLYICTSYAVSDGDKSFFLGDDEINLLEIKDAAAGLGVRVVLDCGKELVKEGE